MRKITNSYKSKRKNKINSITKEDVGKFYKEAEKIMEKWKKKYPNL